MPDKIKKSAKKDFILPFTVSDLTDWVPPSAKYTTLDIGSITVTSGRYDHKVIEDAVEKRLGGSNRVMPSKIRWGKVVHDIVIPTRLVAAGTFALALQVKKGELAVDMTDWGRKTKFAAKAPIWATRQTLAATTALLHLPELVTMPVARGMKASLDEIRKGLKKYQKKEVDTRDVMSRVHGGLKPRSGGLSR